MSKIIGKNIRSYPCQNPLLGYMGTVDVTVVLVEGVFGDYTAYCRVGDENFVAKHGNKIPFEEAQVHFCNGLEEKKYRR